MKILLDRSDIESAVRKELDHPSVGRSPEDLIDFLIGFASAHYVYRGETQEHWMTTCEKAYANSYKEGVARGLVDAPD